MMNNELKPCPFHEVNKDCNKFEFREIPFRILNVMPPLVQVRCVYCGATGPSGETEEAAIAAWNKRAYSWDLLMEILDEVYPADVFDGSSGDVGSRIIMNLREINLLSY